MPDELSKIVEKLNIIINEHDGISKMSAATGISKRTLLNYVNGNSEPKLSSLIKISKATKYNLCEIVSEEKINKYPINMPVTRYEVKNNKLKEVKLAKMGVDQIHADTFIPEEDPYNITITISPNDHMEPEIMSGEQILINTSENARNTLSGLVLMRLENEIFVRRIQKIPNNKIKLTPANKKYISYEIDINDDFEVIGKIRLIVKNA